MFTLIKTKGFSLIEVLMSLLLISLIFFGLDASQIYSLNEAKITFYFNIAQNQLENARERLNTLKIYEGLDEQIAMWNRENKVLLPLGFGTITGIFPEYVLTIYWGNISHHCEKETIGLSGCLTKKIQLE